MDTKKTNQNCRGTLYSSLRLVYELKGKEGIMRILGNVPISLNNSPVRPVVKVNMGRGSTTTEQGDGPSHNRYIPLATSTGGDEIVEDKPAPDMVEYPPLGAHLPKIPRPVGRWADMEDDSD